MDQIEAFIEAGRGPSFRAAAERCALSPSAFSRRIQSFCAIFPAALFERGKNGVVLTGAGRACLAELEPAYRALRRAAASVAGDDLAEGRVTLSLSHSLAVGWLIPRLDRFHALHPQLELHLTTRRDATALGDGEADLGICFTDIDLTGYAFERLLDIVAAPVASPQIAADLAESGDALAGARLLSVRYPPDYWDVWSARTGRNEALVPAARFDILHAMYESASHGLGIALGASPTVWPHLDSGRLVRLPLPAARLPGCYRLAATAARRHRRSVDNVWRWLKTEARKTPELSSGIDATSARVRAPRAAGASLRSRS
jgi:DNA-binding transcriptional LysR family regulator